MGWPSCQEDNQDARDESKRRARARSSRYTKSKDRKVKRERLNVRDEGAERRRRDRLAQRKDKVVKAGGSIKSRLPSLKPSRRNIPRRKRAYNARQLRFKF